MNVARRVLKIYEDHPYPAVKPGRRKPRWTLPPQAWITDLWQPAASVPARILSAGCGTGNEVFALRQRFPKAEIVGIDFCAHSIALARRLQRARGVRGIRFAVADLGSADFAALAGGPFDLISCHGVMSYVPRRDVALKNLARCLGSGGALYLAVNGTAHFSTRWRQVLPDFGIDCARMAENERLPRVVALLDALAGDGLARVARSEPSFFPTDLFGPLIRAVSLREWLSDCRAAGLHFLGSFLESAPFRHAVNDESYAIMIPRSRAEVAEIVDAVAPTGFHRLLLSKDPSPNPPWDQPDALRAWRPLLAPHLRDFRWPQRRGARKALRPVRIKSALLNTQLDLVTRGWIMEVLRRSRGEIPLGELVAMAAGSMRDGTLRKQLYLLHQLYFLNFLPPAGEA